MNDTYPADNITRDARAVVKLAETIRRLKTDRLILLAVTVAQGIALAALAVNLLR